MTISPLSANGIASSARLTGLDKDTVQRIMEQAGQQCFQFLADTMQNLKATDIQVDEVWSYVGCKERTAFFQNAGEGVGDAYVFTALDRNTKVLFCFHVGRRTAEDANLFANKLALCVSDSIRPHVSTVGYNPMRSICGNPGIRVRGTMSASCSSSIPEPANTSAM